MGTDQSKLSSTAATASAATLAEGGCINEDIINGSVKVRRRRRLSGSCAPSLTATTHHTVTSISTTTSASPSRVNKKVNTERLAHFIARSDWDAVLYHSDSHCRVPAYTSSSSSSPFGGILSSSHVLELFNVRWVVTPWHLIFVFDPPVNVVDSLLFDDDDYDNGEETDDESLLWETGGGRRRVEELCSVTIRRVRVKRLSEYLMCGIRGSGDGGRRDAGMVLGHGEIMSRGAASAGGRLERTWEEPEEEDSFGSRKSPTADKQDEAFSWSGSVNFGGVRRELSLVEEKLQGLKVTGGGAGGFGAEEAGKTGSTTLSGASSSETTQLESFSGEEEQPSFPPGPSSRDVAAEEEEDHEEADDCHDDDDSCRDMGNGSNVALQLTPTGEVTPLTVAPSAHRPALFRAAPRDGSASSDETSGPKVTLEGLTPLHVACLFRSSPGVIGLLVRAHPPSADIRNGGGMTPLHMVCMGLFLTTAELLSPQSTKPKFDFDDDEESAKGEHGGHLDGDAHPDWDIVEVVRQLLEVESGCAEIPYFVQSERGTFMEWSPEELVREHMVEGNARDEIVDLFVSRKMRRLEPKILPSGGDDEEEESPDNVDATAKENGAGKGEEGSEQRRIFLPAEDENSVAHLLYSGPEDDGAGASRGMNMAPLHPAAAHRRGTECDAIPPPRDSVLNCVSEEEGESTETPIYPPLPQGGATDADGAAERELLPATATGKERPPLVPPKKNRGSSSSSGKRAMLARCLVPSSFRTNSAMHMVGIQKVFALRKSSQSRLEGGGTGGSKPRSAFKSSRNHTRRPSWSSTGNRSTKLCRYIADQDWQPALRRVARHPEEAGIWTTVDVELAIEQRRLASSSSSRSRSRSSSSSKAKRERSSSPDSSQGAVGGSTCRLPIHIACALNPPPEIISALRDAFPEGFSRKGQSGQLPLHVACHRGASEEVVRMVLDAFPRAAKMQDGFGRVPLHHARVSGAGPGVVEAMQVAYAADIEHLADKPGSYRGHKPSPECGVMGPPKRRGSRRLSWGESSPRAVSGLVDLGRRRHSDFSTGSSSSAPHAPSSSVTAQEI